MTDADHRVGPPGALPEESVEDLYEHAPCGYLSTHPDGRIVRVNETFISWTGYDRAWLLGGRRIQELLSPGSRIFHETHLTGILSVSGRVHEIAAELVRADGGRLDVLFNAARRDVAVGGHATFFVRYTVLDARDRRRHERELMEAKREAEAALARVRQLEGLLPLCAWCHQIRADSGEWLALEVYLEKAGSTVTHSICGRCAEKSGLAG